MCSSDLEIWDEDNRPVPVGTSGQIVARTDGQMTGFWNDPEGTRQRMVDGWVLTGDIGLIDRNGYLYLLDRADDMIISGGYNIWPMELENAIAGHPAVMEVAVFGIPDARWGETPVVIAVAKRGASLTPAELLAYCRERLASYKRPTGAALVDRFPMTGIGKSSKAALRDEILIGAVEIVRAG